MRINIFNFENLTRYIMYIGISLICAIFILLCFNDWKEHKQLANLKSKVKNLEQHISEQRNYNLEQATTLSSQLQNDVDKLQQKFTELASSMGTVESTEYGYQLRAVLRLTTLAAMHLTLGKEESLAKDLLRQAINKLININDTRLNPILYNLQDEYANLLDEHLVNHEVREVWQKIDQTQALINKLQDPIPVTEDLFIADNTNNNKNVLPYFKTEMMHIYLEQAKLAYLQSNTFLYKSALDSVDKVLSLEIWSPQVVSEIQEHLKWLANIEIKNYSLLLQAILNLEDQLKN